LVGYRLKLLNRAAASLDIEVVIMSLLLDSVQALLKRVLTMGDETRIFGSPCWMRRPLVVQNRSTKFVAPTAYTLALAPREQTIARAEAATVRKRNTRVDSLRTSLLLLFILTHKLLEPSIEFLVSTDE
jgi:hypothetical protein